MTFFKNFNAKNNLQAILYLMGTDNFEFESRHFGQFCHTFFLSTYNVTVLYNLCLYIFRLYSFFLQVCFRHIWCTPEFSHFCEKRETKFLCIKTIFRPHITYKKNYFSFQRLGKFPIFFFLMNSSLMS